MPEPSDLYVDVVLSDLSVGYRNPGYIADGLLPYHDIDGKEGKYPVFGFEAFNIPFTKRAPRARSARVDWTLSWESIVCEEESLEQPLDDQERQSFGSVNAEQTTTLQLTDRMLLAREKRAADLLTSTSVITHYDTLTGDEQWNDADNASDPIKDVDDRKEVLNGYGILANTVAMSRSVFNVLRRHPLIREQLSAMGTGGTEVKIVTPQILAVIFDVERVLVAGAVKNVADEGQTVDLDPVWGDTVIVCRVESGPALVSPFVGKTFRWRQMGLPRQITVYREAPIKSDVYGCAEHVDEVVCCANAATLLVDVLA